LIPAVSTNSTQRTVPSRMIRARTGDLKEAKALLDDFD